MKRASQITPRQKSGLAGAGLVGLTGVGAALGGYLLELPAHERDICLYIGLMLLTFGGALAMVPWERLPQRMLLLPPAIVVLALGVVGLLVDTQSQVLLAFMVFAVVYVGLTQPPGTTLIAMPVLLADWWLSFPSHPVSVLARLPLVIAILLTAGEVPAWSQRRWSNRVATLWESSNTDPLTNVGNRRALARELADLPVGGTIMFIDLDHFKQFNDRYGHAAGDVVLLQFATVVTNVLRATDVVARFGGEEFVILVKGPVKDADLYARIRDAWYVAGAAVTFSAGFARRTPSEVPAVTLSRADAALYQAKINGRDRFELAPDLTDDAVPMPRREVEFENDDFTVRDFLDKLAPPHSTTPPPRENAPTQSVEVTSVESAPVQSASVENTSVQPTD